jgi:xanthine dehydrogenase accessory factor
VTSERGDEVGRPGAPSRYELVRDAIRAEEPVALATVVEVTDPADWEVPPAPGEALPPVGANIVVRPGLDPKGTTGDRDLDRVVVRDATGALQSGHTGIRHYGRHGQANQREVAVFIEAFAPPPTMVIFGAVDFTAALARVAKILGYRVTVCDARPVFATAARFPMADEVVVDWPDRHLAKVGAGLGPRDAVCVLTHDPKFDVPAIVAALATRVGYLGAMGSRRTHAERTTRLLEAGVADADLPRIMGPIGLDIGARTPEETAVSICAEIIALRARGSSGEGVPSLRDLSGPIHRGGVEN